MDTNIIIALIGLLSSVLVQFGELAGMAGYEL